ncbi:MAG: autotransporter-associated beta strand repeat-containing protein [Tepidisphaeraceae bacterium]
MQSAAVDSSGTINIATGGSLTVKGSNSLLGFFGDNAAGLNFPTTATINVNGGTFNWSGNDAHATLWLGGDSITNHVGKAAFNLNSGTANGGAVRVGDFGQGELNVSGGTLTSNFYMAIGLGNNPNQGHGTVNVTGGVLNLAQVTLNENKTEECVFNQSGGTVNVGGVHGLDGYNFRIGYSDHGKGTYNMTGGTLSVSGNDLYVGRGQSGEMNISGTSSVNVNTLTVDDRPNADFAVALGGIDNGTAVINQNGGSVFIAPTSLLGVFYHGSNGGTETYNLKGGTLTTNGISAEGGSTVKTFNFDGGTLVANKNFAVPNPNWSNPENFNTVLSTGGGTVNTGSFTVTWNNVLSGNGALTKTGAGTLSLTNENTYTGATTVNAGTLLAMNIAGSATGTAAVTVNAAGAIGGTGIVSGATTVNGTLSPGTPGALGTLTFGSTLTLASSATTNVRLASSSSFDHADATTSLAVAGTLALSELAGYVPAYGQTHRVLTSAALSGQFAAVTGNQVTADHWLAVTYDATGVNVVAALPGDANLDATVNFSDLLLLAANYGTSNKAWTSGDFDGNSTVNFSDLLALAAFYGQSVSGSVDATANFAADWRWRSRWFRSRPARWRC